MEKIDTMKLREDNKKILLFNKIEQYLVNLFKTKKYKHI